MSEWTVGKPKALLADLRPGGWVMGQSGLLPALVRLHKTDIMSDLRRLTEEHKCLWRIKGDPNGTGRYAKDRRTIVIWLGK